MAVKIRLMRVGKTRQPSYRVVVADGRSPRDGRIIEAIGQYQPRRDPSFVQIDADAALSWLRKGAQPTDEVQKLFAIEGIWQTFESERGAPVNTKAVRRTREMARAGLSPRGPKKEQPPEPVGDAPTDAAPGDAPADAATGEAPGEGTSPKPEDVLVEDGAADEEAAEDGER